MMRKVFAVAVKEAHLASEDKKWKQSVDKFLSQNSWDKTWERMNSLILEEISSSSKNKKNGNNSSHKFTQGRGQDITSNKDILDEFDKKINASFLSSEFSTDSRPNTFHRDVCRWNRVSRDLVRVSDRSKSAFD